MLLDERLRKVAADILRSRMTKDPLDWFEANITEIPSSPRRGPFDRKVYPWCSRAIEILTDHETRRGVMVWGTQLGKSFTESAVAMYLIANQPGHMMITQDTQDNADDFNHNTFRKLMACCPPLDGLLVKDSEKSDTLAFRNGVVCYIKSANNEANLQRRTLRYVIADECWEYQPNRIDQVAKRTDKFKKLAKVILASQGSDVGDEFHREWMQTDRAQWSFKCPSCGLLQPWVLEGVRFPESAKTTSGWNLELVEKGTTYECAGCRIRLPDRDDVREECNAGGDFVAECRPRQVGYRGLCVPAFAGLSWGELGAELIKSQEAFDIYGDEEPRKTFKQKRQAQFWSSEGGTMVADSKASDYLMGEDWVSAAWITPRGRVLAERPKDTKDHVRLRTFGADKQLDHYYVVIRDFALSGESRLVWCGRVEDGWMGLETLAKKFGVHRSMAAVDSGYSTQEVYEATARLGWKATKGFGQDDFAVSANVRRFYSEPESIVVRGGRFARLLKFSNLALKDMLHGLRLRKLHTYASDVPEDYARQLDAEVRVKKPKGSAWELRQGVRDNHYLDAEVIALLLAVRWGIGGRDADALGSTEVQG